MTNANVLSNSTSSSALQLLTDHFDQIGEMGEQLALDGLRIAIIKNINNGFGDESIERARTWFVKMQPNTEIGEIPEDLCNFLGWLRPVNEQWLLAWATASLSCIETELSGSMQREAIDWLYAELAQEVGESSAIICIAEYLQPQNAPMQDWAEGAFARMMQIENLDQKSIALTWLEEQIAQKLGSEQAHATIARWMHEHQSPTQSSAEQRVSDTMPCAPPSMDSNVHDLKPAKAPKTPTIEPEKVETLEPKPQQKAPKKENPLQVIEQRISGLKQEVRRITRELNDRTGGSEDELQDAKGQLALAESQREALRTKNKKSKSSRKAA